MDARDRALIAPSSEPGEEGRRFSPSLLLSFLADRAGRPTPPSLFARHLNSSETIDMLARAAAAEGFAVESAPASASVIEDVLLPAGARLKSGAWVAILRRDPRQPDLLIVRTGSGSAVAKIEEARLLAAVAEPLLWLARSERDDPLALLSPDPFALLRAWWREAPKVWVAGALCSGVQLALPFFSSVIYDTVIPHAATDTLLWLAGGAGILIALDLLFRGMQTSILQWAGEDTSATVGTALFRRLLDIRLDHRPDSAGKLASAFREFNSVREILAGSAIPTLTNLPFIFLAIAAIAIIAPPIALVPVAGGAIVAGLGWWSSRRQAPALAEAGRLAAERQAVLIEAATYLRAVKHQRREGGFLKAFQSLTAAEAAVTADMQAKRDHVSHAVGALQNVMIYGLPMFGAWLVMDNHLTSGVLMSLTMMSSRAISMVGQFSSLLPRLIQARQAIEQLRAFLARPTERDAGRPLVRLDRARGDLVFQDVVYGYDRAAPPILKGVSVDLQAGSKIAIMGRNGAGKSTLVSLLPSFNELWSGRILVDGIDHASIDPDDLRRNIVVVDQEPVLFGPTLLDALGEEGTIPPAEIERVLHLVGLGSLLPGMGLARRIGEGGRQLSTGQRQRCAIARVLLLQPAIVILDEPTSALPEEDQVPMTALLAQATARSTVLLVTHLAQLLGLVDHIMFLRSNGEVDRIVAKSELSNVVGLTRGPSRAAE